MAGESPASVLTSISLPDTGDGRNVAIEWTSESDGLYHVQSSTNLLGTDPWATLDMIAGQAGATTWTEPEPLDSPNFYRLLDPQPEVFSVEPTVVDVTGSNNFVYILGQKLPTNAEVRIDGIAFTPELVNSNGVWARVSLNGLPPGVPRLELAVIDLDTGEVVATLPHPFVAVSGPQVSPYGPPDEPPASPAARGGGHVTVLKLHGATPDAAAGRQEYRGHVTVLKQAEAGDGKDDDCDGVAVFPATGEITCEETDLAVPGRGLDFVWTRTYLSRTGPSTPQGHGWDFSYNVSLAPQPDGTLQVCTGNGRCDTFYPGVKGTWVRDEYFCEVRDLTGDGMPDVLFADGGQWLFNPLGTPEGGKLSQIVDRNGNTIALDYDGAGRLAAIVDTLGRTNTVAYGAAGLIESVTDFSGRTVHYEYDGNGDLISCTSPAVTGTPNGNDFPDGKTVHYSYTQDFADDRLNHNLASVIDPKGQTRLEVVYQTTTNAVDLDFDAAASMLRGVEKKDIKRGMVVVKPGSRFAVVRGIENDGVGNVREYFYDSRNRLVTLQEFTGRANPDLPTTETENRPTGKLRDTDPDVFETAFEWNRDSLCTRVVYPRGNETQCVYERDFDKAASPRRKGDLRVMRDVACGGGADTDGDGSLDLTERAWRLEYDPRFGSPPARMRTRVKELEAILKNLGLLAPATRVPSRIGINEPLPYATLHVRKGWDGTVKGASLFDDEDCDGFATRITDPRGNVTSAEYDTNGNAEKITYHAADAKVGIGIDVPSASFVYNPHGQLTAVTNAPGGNGSRRVDTCSYYDSGPGAGLIESATCDADGLTLTTAYEYDERGNLTRCVDPRGFDTLYTYNALDQVVRRRGAVYVYAGGHPRYATDYSYDANDNLVQVDHENRDGDGVIDPANPQWTTTYEYDSFDRLLRVTEEADAAASLATEYGYDANDNLTRVRSPEAVSGHDPYNVVSFEYDERDLLFRWERSVDAHGALSEDYFGYNENGSVTQQTRVAKISAITLRFDKARYQYDGFDRRVSVRDAMGNATTMAFDRNDNLVYERFDGETNDVPGSAGNLRLSETRYQYDGLDRLVRTSESFFDVFTGLAIGDGESTRTFAYAPNGQLTAATDDNGKTTSYSYDTAGRLWAVTDPRQDTVVCTYDACGNLTAVHQTDRSDVTPAEQTFRATYEYDGLDRVIRSEDNVGNTNGFAYDSQGNCVSEVDPQGNEVVRAYDGLSRLTDTVCYDGAKERGITINTSHVEYQTTRLHSVTDGNSNTTAYAYDSLDRCVAATNADGTIHRFVWDSLSDLALEKDANGTVVSNRYDLLDRCVRRDVTPGPGVADTTTFEEYAYDGRSLLVSATNDDAGVSFRYDSLEAKEKAKADCLAVARTSDGEGNCLSLTYRGGRTVQFTYDALNQLSSVRTAAPGRAPETVATLQYDGPGRLARVVRGNGISSRFTWNGLLNPPNPAGDYGWQQVRGVRHHRAGGGAVVDERACAYDRAQNKVLRAQTVPFVGGSATTTNVWAYDALGRLSRTSRKMLSMLDYSRTYVLDANGNRVVVTNDGVAGAYQMDDTPPEPGDFQMDQYTLTPFGAEQHDRNGNLVQRDGAGGLENYFYDYADRLVAVTDATNGPIVSYTYDPLGRCVYRTTYPPAPADPVTTQFLYDEGRAVEERVNGALTRAYVWPDDCDDRDPPIAAFSAAGEAMYYHADELGNVLALTDAAGNVLERYDYDDYGVPVFLDAEGLPLVGGDGLPVTESLRGNPYLFHGMFWDGETGLYAWKEFSPAEEQLKGNPRHRTAPYDPKTGRLCKRPGRVKYANITLKRNAYTFAGDNPWSTRERGSGMATGRRAYEPLLKTAGSVMFNPREYTITKATPWKQKQDVYVWKLKKEEGGRHTPFHNKYRPQLWTSAATGDSPPIIRGSALGGLNNDPKWVGRSTITGVEMFRKILDYGEAGDNVGLILRGHRDVGGYRARGGGVTTAVKLIVPIAMDKGLRF